MRYILVAAAAIAMLSIAGYWEYSVWGECRSDHSFYYCMRVLSK